jgi:hypothetical protein
MLLAASKVCHELPPATLKTVAPMTYESWHGMLSHHASGDRQRSGLSSYLANRP